MPSLASDIFVSVYDPGSMQVRVYLQLPLLSQLTIKLGRSEATRREGAAARSPQIRPAPELRQGTGGTGCPPLQGLCSSITSALPDPT